MKTATQSPSSRSRVFLESLEERIAPAMVETGITAVVAGTPILLGDGVDSQGKTLPRGLGSAGPYAGEYYLYVEKGQALVFTTDLNGDGSIDRDEITGIAAGPGLRLLSFVNINGDIVTNLNADGTLTDSDGDASNGRDGRIVLNHRIDGITLRSVTASDLTTSSVAGSPNFNNNPFDRLTPSRYSIYGNIYAGGGLGTLSAAGTTATHGLLIDTSGFAEQNSKYINLWFNDLEPTPSVGHIFTGTEVSGRQFSFGTSVIPAAADRDAGTILVRGSLADFTPAAGVAGGDVVGIRAVTGPDQAPASFYIGGIETGDGGFGARGGDIRNVSLHGDVGGFRAIAGDGGNGVSGGAGGSVLGFTATASPNSTVNIQTGDGGLGLLGAAGRAGTFQADGPIELYGNVVVGLGSGGSGTGNAGAGTSLSNASFRLFGPGDAAPANFISTMRAPGDLGTSSPIDFNGDGLPDVVFVTQNTQQLGVAFGNGAGGFRPEFLILEPSIYAASDLRMSPVVVTDLNNDGFAEIITASSSGTTFGGIKTFWNLGADVSTGAWLGFDTPRYSASPFGDRGADTNLAVGDFDGDGLTDVAVVENFRFLTNPIRYGAYITLMSGLRGADGQADGFFAANYAKDPATGLPTLQPTTFPFSPVDINDNVEAQLVLKATAARGGDPTSDVLVTLVRDVGQGAARFNTYGFIPNGAPLPIWSLGPGINELSSPLGTEILFSERIIENKDDVPFLVYEMEPTKLLRINAFDFSIVDIGGDGIFDVVFFGAAGEFSAAAVFKGTADGALEPQPLLRDERTTGLRPDPPNATYYGIAITAPTASSGSPQIPRVLNSELVHDVARAIDIDPSTGQVAYGARVPTTPAASAVIFTWDVRGYGQYPSTLPGFEQTTAGIISAGSTNVRDDAQAVVNSAAPTRDMYFGYYATPAPARQDYAGLSRSNDGPDWALGPVTDLPRLGIGLVTNSLEVRGGNGGQSFLGRGGAGGSIGTGSVGPFDEATGLRLGSINERGFGVASFLGGTGGSGFLGGGNGGSLAGISTQGLSRDFSTGAGGASLFGNGGNGGAFSGNWFDGVNTDRDPSELNVIAGDGGFGLRGGNGGSVRGAGNASLPDTIVHLLTVAGGHGAEGIAAGGAGGAISDFRPQMGRGSGAPAVIAAAELDLRGGVGGDAVAGPGGAGGSVVSSSPAPFYNSFNLGPLILHGGAGGNGLTGGAGGSVTTFVNRPTGGGSPDSAEVHGGAGGDGVAGRGGNGGSVRDVQAATSGLTLFAMLAGNGGLSAAGAAGAGGVLSGSNQQVTSGTGSMVAAAGVGGAGLTRGGAGGSVSGSYNASANSANGGLLAVAGAGGDAFGVNLATVQRENPAKAGITPEALPLFQQLWAMGRSNGIGGNGGSITGFTQPGGTDVTSNLVAGNGGSTINYGQTSDKTTGAGRGGSITNVKLQGDAGAWAPNLAIRSYVPFGQPMDDFVATVRDGTVTHLDPSVGNVGVVVGQAGFVRNDQPASAGVTGSVSGFEAGRIMSMVAGSVDRIAAITSVSGLRFDQAGAFKAVDLRGPVPHINGNAFYSGENYTGRVVEYASPGGSLVDGALLTKKFTPLPGQPPPQRLF